MMLQQVSFSSFFHGLGQRPWDIGGVAEPSGPRTWHMGVTDVQDSRINLNPVRYSYSEVTGAWEDSQPSPLCRTAPSTTWVRITVL